MAFTLFLKAPGEKGRPPRAVDAVVHLAEPGTSGYPIHHNLDQCLTGPQVPPASASAFLLTALGVWAADKLVLRCETPDAWTRDLTLSLPTAAPWSSQLPGLAALLNFLTGDTWTLTPREMPLNLGFQAQWPHAWLPRAVALFSGGLDSLVGAIDLLEAGQRSSWSATMTSGSSPPPNSAWPPACRSTTAPTVFITWECGCNSPHPRRSPCAAAPSSISSWG
jgi:hypothetical protein